MSSADIWGADAVAATRTSTAGGCSDPVGVGTGRVIPDACYSCPSGTAMYTPPTPMGMPTLAPRCSARLLRAQEQGRQAETGTTQQVGVGMLNVALGVGAISLGAIISYGILSRR